MRKLAPFVPPWVLTCLIVGCQSEAPTPKNAPAIPVTVAFPLTREVIDYGSYTGRTQAIDSVEVRARVSGYLDKSFNNSKIEPEPMPGQSNVGLKAAKQVGEGQEVEVGDLLFRIDKRPYRAEYDRLQAQIERDEARLKKTEADFRRSVDLFRRGVLSREDYDKSEAEYSESKAGIDADRAALERARLDLEFCDVTAPISGRIGRAMVTEGNLISTGPTGSPVLTTIVSQDPIFVYFKPDERSMLKFVKERAPNAGIDPQNIRDARITVELGLADEGDLYPYQGVIDFADNQVDPSTGTITVRARFDNPKRQLTPGLFCRVRIPDQKPHAGLLVPEQAIVSEQTNKYVWLVGADDVVKRQDVTLGNRLGRLREIKEGLKANDRVIIRGLQRARPDIKVVPELLAFDDEGRVVRPASPAQPVK